MKHSINNYFLQSSIDHHRLIIESSQKRLICYFAVNLFIKFKASYVEYFVARKMLNPIEVL